MVLHALTIRSAPRRLRLQPDPSTTQVAAPQVHQNGVHTARAHHQVPLRLDHEGVRALRKGPHEFGDHGGAHSGQHALLPSRRQLLLRIEYNK